MIVDLLVEEVGVDLWLQGKEGLAEAGRESRSGFFHSKLSSSNLSSVAGVEMIDRLLGGEFGDRRKHREGVAGEENDIFGVPADSWQFGVGNVLQGV